jgi:hypothetical protein
MKNLLKKLHAIQCKVRAVAKDEDTRNNYNPNGFKYVSGDKIIGFIRPLMDEHGVILKSEVISVSNQTQDYTTSKGNPKKEVFTSITMKMTWIDVESGESMECMWAGNGMNDWDKGFGSAVTYAIRYFLLKQFLVSTDEDDVDAIIRPDGKEKADKSSKPAASPQTPAKEKPWLDESSENYAKVVAHITKGGSIDDVYKKYRVNKEVKAKLTAIKTN